MRARLAIELHRAGDGSVVARGSMAVAPFWCRWDGATLWLVGSAATPVGDDDIAFDLHVGEDVRATVRSVAAMVVYAAEDGGTRLRTRLSVASGAALIWQPEPVIVTARARHRSELVADVAPGGRIAADEVVVLGRSGEDAGRYVAVTDLRCHGEPVSLTSFDTATPGWAGPGGTGGTKVIGTRMAVDAIGTDADLEHDESVDATTVVLRPHGGGAIATALASDPVDARRRLDRALPLDEPSADRPGVARMERGAPDDGVSASQEALAIGR